MISILFICHGNICRSPMAEFVMKDLAAKPSFGLCGDEVADPWYTDDFETTWRDVLAGCRGLLEACKESLNLG